METRTIKTTGVAAQDQVLATALRLFTQKGYFNTSVHDIVRESGVSIGSIYHHFHDKEGLAKALYNSLVARLQAELEAIETHFTTAHDRCRAVVEWLFRFTEEEPEMMAYMLHAKHQEFMPKEPPICSSRPFKQMRDMVRDGMASGEVRTMDPLVAASAVFGGPLRLIHLRLDGLLEQPLPAYLEEVWQCSWRAVAA